MYLLNKTLASIIQPALEIDFGPIIGSFDLELNGKAYFNYLAINDYGRKHCH